ncbi:hypothetical protein BCR34DRAFT_286855 [Clohesyomyces aquaticus]|uniref:Uncharacterized protein n=1 Tax=Clohesyomyces aquaticus TaxID=1231657 RepID=A0A1Y1ZRL0_9PLEO|nr:hypothetical protein BCR34DRAFT_286855 [Clohesyomyces aquaticus]
MRNLRLFKDKRIEGWERATSVRVTLEIFRHDSTIHPDSTVLDGGGNYWILFFRTNRVVGKSYKMDVVLGVPSPESAPDTQFLHLARFGQMPSLRDNSNVYTRIDIDDQVKEPGTKEPRPPSFRSRLDSTVAEASFDLKETDGISGVALMLRSRSCSLHGKILVGATLLTATRFSSSEEIFVKLDDGTQGSRVTAAAWAAQNGWKDGLDTLLESGHNGYELEDSDGRSALSWAAGNGQNETTDLLLGKANINSQDKEGRTPLSWASGNGHHAMVTRLLKHGAKWTADAENRSPLWWAADGGHESVVEIFLGDQTVINEDTSDLVDSADRNGESPLLRAAQNGHISALRLLVEKGLKHSARNASINSKTCLASYLRTAAEKGLNSLLVVSMELNEIQDPWTEYCEPLCVAARKGHTEIVRLLLSAGADPDSEHNGDTALCISVQNGRENVIKLLLEFGANVRKRGVSGTPRSLVGTGTILAMLAAADDEGRLAKSEDDTNPDTDSRFDATVFSFEVGQSATVFYPTAQKVDSLLAYPKDRSDRGPLNFRWIHLPANNMRWVELLMMRLQEKSNRAYEILKPERWTRRQHLGATGAPHARFMRPLCQAFASGSIIPSGFKGKDPGSFVDSPDVVLFMPFLHWDLRGNSGVCHEQKDLVLKYLNNTYHSLHDRRTLDQYYYHTLPDTKTRDNSQVITRYQGVQGENDLRVVSMVDQLWLWVIRGSGGQPDTVVTCFPSVGKISVDESYAHPDPYDDTDVLESIKRHLRDNPSTVGNANDLAGVIAAVCSRNYLDPGTTLSLSAQKTGVQFSDVYETAIGDIVNKESTLFEAFKGLEANEVAEIKDEISLLHEIKDVLDELNIMSVLYQDQRKVIKALAQVEQSIGAEKHARDTTGSENFPPDELNSSETLPTTVSSTSIDDEHFGKARPGAFVQREDVSFKRDNKTGSAFKNRAQLDGRKATKTGLWSHGGGRHVSGLPTELLDASINDVQGMVERANRAYKALNFLVDLKFRHNNVIDSKRSLELSTETANLTAQIKSSEEKSAALTERIRESTDATQRSARESAYLAQKADKEGRTVMVFTVVTIIFLPLSFMATMFQLNIRQYKRVEVDNNAYLDLGYVSSIMFPISTVVSAVLIWVAFKAEYIERLWLKKRKSNERAGV